MSARAVDTNGIRVGLRSYLDAADLLEPLDLVARAYHVPQDEILSMLRSEPACSARLAFWTHLHDVCGWSYPTIAYHWSCDHSTAFTGCRRFRASVMRRTCPPALLKIESGAIVAAAAP
jgi:hypothetical protein